jgi:hypothetical protein
MLGGCCSVFHVDCPQQDYWSVTDAYAKSLNDRYGNSHSQIVPLPLADNYQIGTTIDKGIANGYSCIFQSEQITNFTSPMLAAESNSDSIDLSLTAPTNISQFTAGFGIQASNTVFVSYTDMTIDILDAQYYIPVVVNTNDQCVSQLAGNITNDPNTMMIVGYVSGKFQMSQSSNFQIDLNAAAYGANGKIAYTNSGGWTVMSTNSVHCFAIVSKPQLTHTSGPGFEKGVVTGIQLARPNSKEALKSVAPPD